MPETTDYQRGLEDAATIADAYAAENFQMATDTILTDPVLARRDTTEAALAASAMAQTDGCIHASMAHAAKNIAAAIRDKANA